MDSSINVSEARNRLPELIQQVMTSRQPVTLMRYGKPAAVITPVGEVTDSGNSYPLRGTRIEMSDDFNAPSSELWQAYEVAEDGAEYE